MSRPTLRPGPCLGTILFALVLFYSGPLQAEYLGGISFDRPSPSFLPHGVRVHVDIQYKIDDPAGRYIFVMPYSDGAPVPDYGVSPSGLHGPGTGTASAFFTVTDGDRHVDHLRVYMRDVDFTEVPLEIFVPVGYSFGPHGIYDIEIDHSPHSRLPYGTRLNIEFAYGVDAPGCLIFARPYQDGELVSGYVASGSVDLPPSGTYDQHFRFDADADITDIGFKIYTLDNTTLLDEFFVPWECHWRQWGVYDIEFNVPDGESMHNTQKLVAEFTIDHDEPEDVCVWVQSIRDGSYCPGSVYQPSPYEPSGPHVVSRYTRVASGTATIDHVRVILGRPDDHYLTFDVPMVVDYGPHALQNVVFEPASPAILTHDEYLSMTWAYVTDAAEGVRTFARAVYHEEPLYGITATISPLYPAPSGVGSSLMLYGVDTLADGIRFEMREDDQSVVCLERIVPGDFVWGESGTVTATDPPPVPMTLGRCRPNPFNPITTIPLTLGSDTHVDLTVYDLRGRRVSTIFRGVLPAGRHDFVFDGSGLASGAYVCRLRTEKGVESRRMTLVK